MVDTAEKMIAELRVSVVALSKDVEELSKIGKDGEDFAQKVRLASELVTQALVKVDSVQISKDAAATALREGDRKTSRQLSVLLARRKTIVKRLNELGDMVDKLTTSGNADGEIQEKAEDVAGDGGTQELAEENRDDQ